MPIFFSSVYSSPFLCFVLLRGVVPCRLCSPLPGAFQVFSRRHSPLRRVSVKQLTIRADSIWQGQRQNTSRACEAMRAHVAGSHPSGTCAPMPSRCCNVVHLSIVSIHDLYLSVERWNDNEMMREKVVVAYIRFLYWYLVAGNKGGKTWRPLGQSLFRTKCPPSWIYRVFHDFRV
jgi:hypothetical protein